MFFIPENHLEAITLNPNETILHLWHLLPHDASLRARQSRHYESIGSVGFCLDEGAGMYT